MYEFWLAVHIVCAVLWVGGGVTLHVLGRWSAKSGDPEQMRAFALQALKLSVRLYAPLAILLLLAGIMLVREVGYSYGDLWISLGMLAWIVSLALGVLFYPREERRLERADGDARSTVNRVLMVNSIEITILVLVVVDMAVKPGA